MAGELDEIIEALIADNQTTRLSELEQASISPQPRPVL
jgi:protein subunit release factor A